MEDELIVPSEILVATTTTQEDMKMPPIISLEGPDVEPQSGSFAVLSQYLIDRMDTLEKAVPEVVHLSNFRPRKTPGPSEF